jgi:DNA (cytosine-5)-methyltransferase 1
MKAYYNENDPKAAEWLRQLIAGGHIADGEVDEKSILDVEPADLAGFRQCHFFAGIGGWSYALRLAGWPDDRPVWTGSPPCQPFSVAGKGLARDDERHLAPHFLDLVTACRPPALFGEQVASADVFGSVASSRRRDPEAPPKWAWVDDVQSHLEDALYAFWAVDLPAAGVGAPHLRQRCFFVAYDLMADADGGQPGQAGGLQPGGEHRLEPEDGGAGGVEHPHDARPQGRGERGDSPGQWGFGAAGVAHRPGQVNGFWRDADWLLCTDERWRPTEPGIQPLAHGVPGRVGLLRGAGNAIVPQVAAEFVMAFEEARS